MLLFIYSATIFAGSYLLFLIQPMITKAILPYLGGSPMVWNTSLVFFQVMLLGGYVYAHATARWLPPKRQGLLHAAIVLLSLSLFPVGLVTANADPSEMPVPWLLTTLLVSIGLPYVLLAANATLTQHWFAHTNHPIAQNPYTLYVTSNFASLAGLLCFPFLIEPWLDFEGQSSFWSIGYGVFAGLIVCALLALFRQPNFVQDTALPEAKPIFSWRQRCFWIALAFIPSSLLQGVTSHLLTDIASLPLLWVIPLALYLLTFMLAFSRFGARLSNACWDIMPALIVLLTLLLTIPTLPAINFFAQLALFFPLALACHGLLAQKRPPPSGLTEFYVWVSVGGALGGVFNALLAPILFDRILEYPLTIAFLCLFMPVAAKSWKAHVTDSIPALLFILALAILLGVRFVPAVAQNDSLMTGLMAGYLGLGIGAFGFLSLTSGKRPVRLALCMLGFYFLTPLMLHNPERQLLHMERNFFGVIKISYSPKENATYFAHGTTIHGIQSNDPEKRLNPQAYYAAISDLPKQLGQHAAEKPIAIIGLGVGTLTCLGREGQEADLYEIDPEVVKVAENTHYFTYLRDCPPKKNVILGDARLKLKEAASHRYGLMVIDAYNSDALPMHLMTREALQLYLDKLAPSGIIAFHISNRNMNLAPTLARLAKDANIEALVMFNKPPESEPLLTPSQWVLMARKPQHFGSLTQQGSPWTPLKGTSGAVWTDHYSNIFEAILARR